MRRERNGQSDTTDEWRSTGTNGSQVAQAESAASWILPSVSNVRCHAVSHRQDSDVCTTVIS